MTLPKTNLNITLMDLSVVIPVYNEEESIQELTEWIEKVCTIYRISFEIIYIVPADLGNLCLTRKSFHFLIKDAKAGRVVFF